ncbi:hypothetical protein [Paenibacillus sp. 23TSA30-6]|nr:hypothetical protein [Paenibacillus sp. 23TSA30-6]
MQEEWQRTVLGDADYLMLGIRGDGVDQGKDKYISIQLTTFIFRTRSL